MVKNTLYIAYGSNLNVAQMGQRCPDAEVYGVGRIADYRLAFKALGAYAYATIEPCRGEYVPVAVWQIGVADEGCLDRYEGYPTHYTKEITEVMLVDSAIRGMAYVMNRRAVHALPTSAYFESIRSGYHHFRLDEEKLFEARCRVGQDTPNDCGTLKYYRHKKGLTQAQLAERTKLSISRIQKYESGERNIRNASAEAVIKLAEVLEVAPAFLLQ